MTSAHIDISTGNTAASAELRSLVHDLQSVVDRFRLRKEAWSQTTAGGDYAALASQLGLPTLEGGEQDEALAQTINDLVSSVAVTLTTDGFIAQLLSRTQ